MEIIYIFALVHLTILVWNGNVIATENLPNPSETTKPLQFKPLQNLIFHQNQLRTEMHTEPLSRVKRQYGYGYGRYGRDRYYPIPIFGGGIGYPAVGPRGFGPRGYGGRGFGGRGFGGRGFGGRGIGGRGIGGRGIGGRGGVGGGRGGRG